MDFWSAVRSCFRQYVGFRGRAPRSEYWFWVLFTILVALGCGVLDAALFGEQNGPLAEIWSLATILPGVAVGARRLHDLDRSGWWMLLPLVPAILLALAFGFDSTPVMVLAGIATLGSLMLLLVWAATRGTPAANRFGPDPMAGGG